MDNKALKILLDTYWDTTGWCNRQPSEEDFEYARSAGCMFGDFLLSHDDIVGSIRSMVAAVDLLDVSNAFLASLSTRRLELRSALGSYAIARHLPNHEYDGDKRCGVCGLYGKDLEPRDVNVLNFERYKWGGVRHLFSPLYVWFDLKQFAQWDRLTPTADDIAIVDSIISAAERMPAEARITGLEKALSGILKSNKPERKVLLEILGYCGILETNEHRGFSERFVRARDIPWPPTNDNDWQYPAAWWRGSDGINRQALKLFFPQYVL